MWTSFSFIYDVTRPKSPYLNIDCSGGVGMSKKDLDSNKDLSYVTSKVVDRVIEWKERRELWKTINRR